MSNNSSHTVEEILEAMQNRMELAIQALNSSLKSITTGRANPSMLENIRVEVYGSAMKLNQIATVTAPESQLLFVQVWDKTNVKFVSDGISNANLGLNPLVEGQILRVRIPVLSTERRNELCKKVGEYTETARIAIRNIRRDAIDLLEKSKDLSKDVLERQKKAAQKITMDFNSKVEQMAADKQKDLQAM